MKRRSEEGKTHFVSMYDSFKMFLMPWKLANVMVPNIWDSEGHYFPRLK